MTSKFDRELQVESITEEDGWFCIVLPGLGFGWVEAANVQVSKDEVISSDTKQNVQYEFR